MSNVEYKLSYKNGLKCIKKANGKVVESNHQVDLLSGLDEFLGEFVKGLEKFSPEDRHYEKIKRSQQAINYNSNPLGSVAFS